MRRRAALFLKLYSLLTALTQCAGLAIGEQRIDLYVSMFILWYFVLAAITDVRTKYWTSALFFTIFVLVVAYRILSILGGLP